MGRVLIVDCFDSFTYNLYHYLDTLLPGQCDVIRYDLLKDISPSDYSRFVLSPGPGLPDEYPEVGRLLSGLPHHSPVLGVCLGLQYMVVHFGGKLRRLEQVKHGLPGQLIPEKSTTLLHGMNNLQVAHYHSWVADDQDFPVELLEVTARDSAGNIMAIQHRSLPWQAVQFHPESVLTPSGFQLIKNWLAIKSS